MTEKMGEERTRDRWKHLLRNKKEVQEGQKVNGKREGERSNERNGMKE